MKYNKVCIVTGGTGGLGSAISKKLSACGYTVIATCRPDREHEIESLKNNFFKEFQNIHIYPVDVSCSLSCNDLVERVTNDFGCVSVLINNAGVTVDSSFKKMTLSQWQDAINNNLNSMFNMTKQVFEPMCKQNWGRIINIASINAQKGQYGQANYSASKAGILGFTKSLAAEGAKFGVTVNSVSPGYISTSMVTNLNQDIQDSIIKDIPIGRFGYPHEIAHAIEFIINEDAGFMTGSNLAVNGGQHMF